MNQRLRYALKYFNYLLFSKHKNGHGIHSPFLFKLIKNIFHNQELDDGLKNVIRHYKDFRTLKQKISYKEIGAGSVFAKKTKSSVGKIIKNSSVSKKYGVLLYNLIKGFDCQNILEIGSSVGISSLFIAQANLKGNFKSIEGSHEKIEIARKFAEQLGQNTHFIVGNFKDKLDLVLDEFEELDFVFFDGNHKKNSTISYFNSCITKAHNDSVFVFDDIHWSKEMEEAWEEIKNHKKVKLSVDLYRMGLIFFKKELSKEHYVIKF